MKLFSFYTPSHRIFKERWFAPSLKENYECIFEECPQECETGQFMAEGWIRTMMRKVDLIVRAIRKNPGEVFVYSDVDVQFFRPMQELLSKLMEGKELLVQQNAPAGMPAEMLCAGFFVCRANRRTLKLWRTVRDCTRTLKDLNEQSVLNGLLAGDGRQLEWMIGRLRKEPCFSRRRFFLKRFFLRSLISKMAQCRHSLEWGLLPPEFFGGGTFTGTVWRPGTELAVSENIVLHHANWTVGIQNKIAQLEYVRRRVRQRETETCVGQGERIR